MKKNFFTFIALILIASASVFAQKDNSLENGLTLGAGLASGSSRSGASVEFGFGLYKKNRMFIRNYIGMNTSHLSNDFTSYGFSERLVIGGEEDITDAFLFRLYAILDFNFSMIKGGASDKKLADAPFILEPRAGFGVEFIMKKIQTGVFMEVLGTEQILTGFYKDINIGTSGVTSVMGLRWYIN